MFLFFLGSCFASFAFFFKALSICICIIIFLFGFTGNDSFLKRLPQESSFHRFHVDGKKCAFLKTLMSQQQPTAFLLRFCMCHECARTHHSCWSDCCSRSVTYFIMCLEFNLASFYYYMLVRCQTTIHVVLVLNPLLWWLQTVLWTLQDYWEHPSVTFCISSTSSVHAYKLFCLSFLF